jgi:hypothetical protein
MGRIGGYHREQHSDLLNSERFGHSLVFPTRRARSEPPDRAYEQCLSAPAYGKV